MTHRSRSGLNRSKLLTSALLSAGALFCAKNAHATVITVTTGADDTSNNGNCTFREAILAVNTQTKRDACPAGNGANDHIILQADPMPVQSLGGMTFLRDVIVTGGVVRIQNQSISFTVGDTTHSPTVVLQKMAIFDTQIRAFSIVSGKLDLYFCDIENAGNPTSSGTALAVWPGQTLNVINSILLGNHGYQGGAINSQGTVNIYSSTIMNNDGEHGGAMFIGGGTLNIFASTISNNSAHGEGGAIFLAAGFASAADSTIVYNSSNVDRICPTGCAALQATSTSSFAIGGSIVAHNNSNNNPSNPLANCSGNVVTSTGHNLLGESAATACPKVSNEQVSTDLTPQDAQLTGPIGFLGSGGFYYMTTATSPLVNAIPVSNYLCSNGNTRIDQRGVARDRGEPFCDIGAVERATMLYVQNTSPDSAFDADLRDQFTQLGFILTVADDDTVVTANASGKQIVFISQSVESSKINTKFRDVTNMVVVDEPNLYPYMKMTGSTANTDYGVQTNVASFTVLSGGLADKMDVVGPFAWTNDSPSPMGFGKPSSAAIKTVMITGSTTKSPMFLYSKGVNMGFGLTAPGARIGYYAQDGMSIGDGGNLKVNAILYAASQ